MTVLGARLVVAVRAAGLHRLRLRRLSSSSANHRGHGSTRSAPTNASTAVNGEGNAVTGSVTTGRPAARRLSVTPSQLAADREHSRTTVTLIAVVLSFVATELPQGIVSLLSAVDQSMFDHVYVPLGDLWDLLILVNSAVNFVLYCTMSRQYRQTFRRVFTDDLGARLRRLVGGRRCTRCQEDTDEGRELNHDGFRRLRRMFSQCRRRREEDNDVADVGCEVPITAPAPLCFEVIALGNTDDVASLSLMVRIPRSDPDINDVDVVESDDRDEPSRILRLD